MWAGRQLLHMLHSFVKIIRYWVVCNHSVPSLAIRLPTNKRNSNTIRTSKNYYFQEIVLYHITVHNRLTTTTENGEWLCNKYGKTVLKSGGWTNLLNCIGSWCVGLNDKSEYQVLVPDKTRSVTSFFTLCVSVAEQDMFRWMEWILMTNLPLNSVAHSRGGDEVLANNREGAW